MTTAPISPVGLPLPSAVQRLEGASQTGSSSFSDLLLNGIENVNNKVSNADNLVRAFVLDDSVPVHQVTYALSQARLSLELMVQVRGRLVEAYQQLMNMQL